MKNRKISIIGAGASGLVAAIFAARNGVDVTIFEKHSQAGRKILATGNGRCNISNTNLEISNFHGMCPEFVEHSIEEFGYEKCKSFFEELGIEYKIASSGRVYPLSNQASSVVELLKYELDILGVKINYKIDIKKIEYKNDMFSITDSLNRVYCSHKVIISTGGKATPALSSDGDGYKFAKSFGHTIVQPFASLVQLKLESNFLQKISGAKVDGSIEIKVDGKKIKKVYGDILFTDYGISGSATLDISRVASLALIQKRAVEISIDIFSNKQNSELDVLLLKRFETRPKKDIASSFVGFINKKLGTVIAEIFFIHKDKKVANLSKKERRDIVKFLKNWQFKVIGTQDFKRAEVTSGGINTDEINSKTMESKIVKGLYFTGEVLDIDGDCGGYNLHWAWASGYIAGSSIIC